MKQKFDALFMGRSGIDLYSNDIGAPFEEITGFSAYVGGSPTNMSVAGRRLGLNTALLTAVGSDPVGDFILRFLNDEGVATEFIPRKPERRTAAVLLGIEPPDRFPLVYYRENCADIFLTPEDVANSPVRESRVLEFAGTNLSREPSRSSTQLAAELAQAAGNQVVIDLDFRPDQWQDVRFFGLAIRSVLPLCDYVIGTDDEINAIMLESEEQMQLTHSQVSDTSVSGDVEAGIQRMLDLGPSVVIRKTGKEGCSIYRPGESPVPVQGFPVEIVNILGAGDAFGAGFIYGLVQEWPLDRAVRFANACGALVVTRHACANSMPTLEEVNEFVSQHGGL